ncbi:MAG: ABC transporter ATP-binding protein [Methanoregulaceae archaeon]|nr:ABC transporter ATP-binding protein [Methanoregulaceae archaeon]
MTIIEARDIGFSFGRKAVLKGIDLDCRDGEVLGIMGQNGSGKTTLLRILAGYLQADRGSVRYGGRELSGMDAREMARLRAVVSQGVGANFDFPVADYVMLGRTPYLSRFGREGVHDYRIVEQALGMTDTTHLQDRPVSRLSGGELQRVMIARALSQEPKVLMLDEPTSHLDIRHQMEIMDLLGDLSKQMAVIAIVHDLNLAARYCGRIALLHEGTIHSCGPPGQVLAPDTIREVFGVRACRAEDPGTGGGIFSFSIPGPDMAGKSRVHVICGGGCGRMVLHMLAGKGYRASAGILNEGDMDLEVARYLAIPVLSAPPFSRIGGEQARMLGETCLEADAVVVVAMPVGEGNIRNLEVAANLPAHIPVVLYSPECTLEGLDCTNGKGDLLYEQIQGRGTLACTLEELAAVLENTGGTSRREDTGS